MRIKWHANNCSELAAWTRKPLRDKDHKTIAAMAHAIHIRHGIDRSILPPMPQALLQAITDTTEIDTEPLLGKHAPDTLEWETWASRLREVAMQTQVKEKRRLLKHGKAMWTRATLKEQN